MIPSKSPEISVASRFTLNDRLHSKKAESESERNTAEKSLPQSDEAGAVTMEEGRTLEIDKIKSDCEQLRIDIDNVQTEMKKVSAQLACVTSKHETEEKELEILEAEKIIKSRTYDLLEDSDNNIAKLKTVIDAGRNKMINLANQWEKHRAPLIKQYRDGREKYSAKTVSIKKSSESEFPNVVYSLDF